MCVLGPAGWALVLGYSRHGVVFALSDCLRSIKRERGGGGESEGDDERNGVDEERGND